MDFVFIRQYPSPYYKAKQKRGIYLKTILIEFLP